MKGHKKNGRINVNGGVKFYNECSSQGMDCLNFGNTSLLIAA